MAIAGAGDHDGAERGDPRKQDAEAGETDPRNSIPSSRIERGTKLGGRYRLLRHIASGGMGSVWEAEDTILNRRVAAKVVSDALTGEHFAERFRREALAAAGLSHPNIAGVFDYGEDDHTQFIVMELIPGETLAERLTEGPVEPAEAVRIAAEVAAALQAAHDAGIVHRDVKPGNIMLTPDGVVKVMDFGIAAAAWAAPITSGGTAMGTATYISPEQAAGHRATPASDVYSLGVVLYEMLAGRPPFTAETPVAVARAHVHQELPPIRKLAPAVPPHIAAACQRALAKDPGERPHSAAAFASMMAGSDGAVLRIPGGAFVDRTLAATPTPESTALLPISEETFAGPARSPWYRGRRGLWGFVAALAVLLGVALLWASLSRSPSSTPRKSRSGPGLVIPDVTGLRVAEAKRVLEAAGLRVGDIRPAPKGKPGRVVRTDPPANTITRRGSAVTLYVGAEPEHGDEGNNGDHGNHKGDG